MIFFANIPVKKNRRTRGEVNLLILPVVASSHISLDTNCDNISKINQDIFAID